MCNLVHGSTSSISANFPLDMYNKICHIPTKMKARILLNMNDFHRNENSTLI
jgi:hypothetical protein